MILLLTVAVATLIVVGFWWLNRMVERHQDTADLVITLIFLAGVLSALVLISWFIASAILYGWPPSDWPNELVRKGS